MADPVEKSGPSQGFWKIAPESDAANAHGGEFPEGASEPMGLPGEPASRRQFLALLGASAAFAGTACTRKIDRGPIVPYTKKPEEIVPGVANYYASTFTEAGIPFGVLVKSREGRPIHVEGNDEHPFARGKAPLRAIADILSLYDPDRLRGPTLDGKPTSWSQAIEQVSQAVKKAVSDGREVLLISHSVVSPSLQALLVRLRTVVPTLRHLQVEPAADPAARAVAQELFGEQRRLIYRFDRARVVLSLGSDFLGSEPGATQAIAQFASQRRPSSPDEPMNRLYAFEGAMTLTGSKADHRTPVRPSTLGFIGFAIARALNAEHGLPLPAGVDPAVLKPFDGKLLAQAGTSPEVVHQIVRDLADAKGEALAVAGHGAPGQAHAACHLLNAMLGAEGATIDSAHAPDEAKLARPSELHEVAADMDAGKVAVAILWGANPSYELGPSTSAPGGWNSRFSKVPQRVRLGATADETALACQWALPTNHWLESWGDFQAGTNLLSLQQPLIAPLFDTLQAEDFLLRVTAALEGTAPVEYRQFLEQQWEKEVYPEGSPVPFKRFWTSALHDGFVTTSAGTRPPLSLRPAGLAAQASWRPPVPGGEWELLLQPDAKVFDGRYANNGWLQELPDPVTKVTWNNPLLLAPSDAARLKIQNGDEVKLELNKTSLLLPALVQPGQARGVLSLGLGYGRTRGSVAGGVGQNTWGLVDPDPFSSFVAGGARVVATGRKRPLARTQEHHALGGREIVKLWDREEYAREVHAEREEEHMSLYPARPYPGHKWGMAIDLSACVGCSACTVACQSENNIPVVGPEQVARGREMAWLRIDRYYEGSADAPRVVHQPMLCQHCDNAPCENVCPVGATNHSPDGLNQMAYNRCVGTRYCANNCPYKVRRFNFFEFNQGVAEVAALAFNPEVTVRPRGVMEKCTFCVQRIANARQVAKAEHRPVRDGEVQPACAAACPAEAIVFGDLNDRDSRVSRAQKSGRGFHVLEELGVQPAITYLADVRNPGKGGHHGG